MHKKQTGNVHMNLTIRRFRVIIVTVESKTYFFFWVCVCSLSFATWKRMRHITLSSMACPALPYFPTLSHKRHDFRGEKFTEHKMCVFEFLHRFVRKVSHSKKDSARYYHKHVLVFIYSGHYSSQILRILELTWKIFCQCEPFFPCGRTDRLDEANGRFSQFCESA
jgi:hypothetical protein